jgi:anti-sigma B factor antagonist
MKFKDKMVGDVGVLSLKGKLLGYPETDELNDEIRGFLGSGTKKIVIDMGGVSWLSSMGVGALMRSFTTVTNNSGSLKLARMTDKARGLFTMTQLIKVFDIYETIDEAIESF